MEANVRSCLANVASHLEHAHLFVDEDVATALSSFYVYMFETLRVKKISALRSELLNSDESNERTLKAVFFIPRFVQEKVSMISVLIAQGEFQFALVCTPLTQLAHLEVYSQGFSDCARSIGEETRMMQQTQGASKLKVSVQTLPFAARSLFPGVLLLPSGATASSLSPPPVASFTATGSSTLPSLAAIPAALQSSFGKTKSLSTALHAQYLASLCLQMQWIPEIFALGDEGAARELGDAFSSACPPPQEVSSATRASFVLLERRWDLVSPCSHQDTILDSIFQLEELFRPLDPVALALGPPQYPSSSSSSCSSSSCSSSCFSSASASPAPSAILPAVLQESKCPPLPDFILDMLLELQPLYQNSQFPLLGPHLLCPDRNMSKEAAALTEGLLSYSERDALAVLCKLLLAVVKRHSVALPPAPPKATPLEKARLLLQLLSQNPEVLFLNAALIKCALLVVAAVEAARELPWPMLRAVEASMTLEGLDDAALLRISDLADHCSLLSVLGAACFAYSLRGSAGFSRTAEDEFVRRLAAKFPEEDAVEIVDGWKQRLQEVGFAREVQGITTPSLLQLHDSGGYTPFVLRLLQLLLPPEGYPSPLPELHRHGASRGKEAGGAKEVVGGLFAAGKMFTSKLLQGGKDVGRQPGDNPVVVLFVLGGFTPQEVAVVQQFQQKHAAHQIFLGSTGVCSLHSGVALALSQAATL